MLDLCSSFGAWMCLDAASDADHRAQHGSTAVTQMIDVTDRSQTKGPKVPVGDDKESGGIDKT